jgi:hypothetical protein
MAAMGCEFNWLMGRTTSQPLLLDTGWHPTRFNPPYAPTLLGVALIAMVSALGRQEI